VFTTSSVLSLKIGGKSKYTEGYLLQIEDKKSGIDKISNSIFQTVDFSLLHLEI
jgi:hypothetical protein